MTDPLLLGVDGGGSGCRARLADAGGRVLGEGRAGPANLTTGFEAALSAVLDAFAAAATAAGLDPRTAPGRTVAVLGLAGAAALGDGRRLAAAGLPFAVADVRSDSEIACVGAHGGAAGGLLVIGTGSQAVLVDEGGVRRFGGWGFALSDGGSGAVLGRAAARRALAAHDGLAPASPFTAVVMNRLGGDAAAARRFAEAARPADWATFAPAVFDHARAGDPAALPLRDAATADVIRLLDRLAAAGAPRLALAGGLAGLYRPLLPDRIAGRLTEPAGDALDGALTLAARRAAGP